MPANQPMRLGTGNEGEKLSCFGSGFFSFGTNKEETRRVSWTQLRDLWEYSHVVRAVLSAVSLIALVIAVS